MAASSVPIPFIDQSGFHMPAFADVLAAHQADYRGVYGSDVILDSSSQDGEWTAIEASAMYDTFALALAVYGSFSPASAQGTGLSSVVKINGITRAVASYSTCDVTIIGQTGTTLTNCLAKDEAGYSWSIPTVTIPFSGQVTVTATCTTVGAIAAAPGSIDQLATPTLGWQSVSNAGAATLGAPVETDPQLRVRQSNSTMLTARGVLDGIDGAIAAIPGVSRRRVYENDTNLLDANGIPGHTIAAVVDGGDATAIATAIAQRKLSAGTYGDTGVTVVTGAAGIPQRIQFFRVTNTPISVSIKLKPLARFTNDTLTAIQSAVIAWINALGIGDGEIGTIDIGRLYGPALLSGTAAASTFTIQSISIARDNGVLGAAPVVIAFNEAPLASSSTVTVSLGT